MSENRGLINVSVANLYREATYGSEVINQGLLGELISVGKNKADFTHITLGDGYQGWISNYQWVPEKKQTFSTKIIRKHFVHIYSEPEVVSEVLRDATIGSYVSVVSENDSWCKIFLPDGMYGWIHTSAFDVFPPPNREGAVQMVEEFLGYPYFWGGRSVKGFDCSGLMQTVFSLIGIDLPRDSRMQHRDGKFVSDNPIEAEPGDLYFFSDSGSKITHVGMALGKGRIIHARGMVKRNSLFQNDLYYSEILFKSFIDVRTFF